MGRSHIFSCPSGQNRQKKQSCRSVNLIITKTHSFRLKNFIYDFITTIFFRYYQIIARQLNHKQNKSSLSSPSSIRQEDLGVFEPDKSLYITLNITQSKMNGANRAFVVGNGKREGGTYGGNSVINA